MSLCNLCPRQCGADRQNNFGFCKSSDKIRVARASLHLWEEPCVSGKNGAGTVFFSGCNLGCVYCQNKEISCGEIGEEVSSERLRSIFLSLIEKGAHNIELVTPTHYIPQIKEALYPKLPVPVIYNSGGYDSVSSGEHVAFFNSLDLLELAVNKGNFASLEGVGTITEVLVKFK